LIKPRIVYNKRLSYRRGTTQRAMLANSCYISRGMAAKFSNSKGEFKGYSRALTIIIYYYYKR